MSLVQHDTSYRRVWMFPRCIRRIDPWKIAQILTLFCQYTNASYWGGNQELQNEFCKALEASGLKRNGDQYDPTSGGPRTYLAQLRSLGLMFVRENNSLWLTKAGQDIVDGKPPLPILQKLLLRYQYPSMYSVGQNVKIHPNIKVKPFVFILKLLNAPEIGYLTNEEMVIPIIYGHNPNCYNICIEKILQLRNGQSIFNIISDDNDYHTPRTIGRTKEKALKDIMDIANTCKNYLQACCLIDTIKEAGAKEQITINTDMLDIIQTAFNNEDKFIPIHNEESFQRAFGSWDGSKDTRNLRTQQPESVTSVQSSIILANFFKYSGKNIISGVPEEFIHQMNSGFGFNKALITDTITPYLGDSLSFFESTFIELSKGGTATALNFEKAVCSLFKDKLNFDARHTGQFKRPSGTVGGYADVFAVALDNIHCAIIDAKASPRYSLSSDDYYKMKDNYIPNYVELNNGKSLKLEFCSYVAGGFSSGVDSKLKVLSNESGVSASAISAFELLNLVQNSKVVNKQDFIRETFKKSKLLKSEDFKEAV